MIRIDVSASMQERDIDPTRFDGAKHAAKEFVRALPRGAKAGLVSFSDTATPVVPPTENHDLVFQAIDGLAIASSTAIGDGILEAVYALPADALDDDTLMGLAQVTGGEYYHVASARELGRAYRALGHSIAWTSQPTEISGLVSAGVALVLMCTLLASYSRMDRIG
jgi:VWA domain-containing protein